ncbi:hypothetical protein PV10_01055 [Exophiala mesophila]|uniref:Uncharacterized protein n=1 Tax=Exophiala mesophila TaxID=212818 RepID=A0A0D2AEE5_EXOME|nr:uncharacterized protein PV10_01055 [Exophiala mesophila]KIV97288.1 hypothetical protein PV10_01055 [Exophiala mesophila]
MAPAKETILITGGTTGLGFYTAIQLAKQYKDASIIVASRKDTDSASTAIRKASGHQDVQFMSLDLGSLKNVRDFVDRYAEKQLAPISLLLLNAGIQFPEEATFTEDKIEATLAVNHVGHALLLHLLLPYLATQARIVVTSSGTHDPAQKSGIPIGTYKSAEDLAHPQGESLRKPGRQRYAESKLANVMWTYALHRRLVQVPDKKWTVVAFDPGLMPGTGLARNAGGVLRFIWHHVFPKLIPILRRTYHHNIWRPQESADHLAFIASKESTSGVYYEVEKPIKSSVDSYDEAKQEDLWAWTIKTIAKDETEAREFEIVPKV